MKNLTIKILLLIIFLINGLFASGYYFTFRKYQVNNGLSENTVQVIHQDKLGFIWLGTKDGLNRFDGNEYRVFRNNPADPHSLGNNFIRSVYEDPEGNLWIGTDRGIFIFDPMTEGFERFMVQTGQGIIIESAVTSICSENEGTLWIGTMTQGFFCYYRETGKLEHYSGNMQDISMKDNVVWRIFRDLSGTIWIGTREGLIRYNRETQNFFTYKAGNESGGLEDSEILSIYEDSDGDIWLGTWSGGLSRLDKTTDAIVTWFGKSGSPYITHIRSVFEYEKEKLLIGADDGLYLFNKKTGEYRRIDDPNDPNSLSDQNVYSIYKDREGGIWIGTYFGGVNYMSSNNKTIEHYYPFQTPGSLSGKAISQFCEDERNNLWIATEDGGLNYFDTQTKKFRVYLPRKGENSLSYHNLHSLLLVGDQLWIGTFSRGLDVLNVKTNTFKNYLYKRQDVQTINDNCIFSLYRRRNGDIYVGTPYGLARYVPDKDNFIRISEIPGFIYDMQEDQQGAFWIATYGNGIFRLDPQSVTWKNYVHTPGNRKSLSYNKVVDIYLDEKQRLWFATEGRGICKYNYELDDFTTIDESVGLPNNVAYGILDDKFGNIWVSTNRGITRINPETLEMKTYTKDDGLQSNQFNYRSSYKSGSGIFYFGGINGFNAFHPDDLKGNSYIPPVAITGIELLDEDPPLPGNLEWKRNFHSGKKVTLKHNQASFKLRFVTMSYQAVENNRYVCMMEGLENRWRSVGNRNDLTYVNLAPGDYTFRVKGSNNDGVWNETGDYLRIEILPPFWKSMVAKLFYAVAILTLLFFLGRFLVRRSHLRQKQKLEEYRLEKEKEMYDTKINFFTQIAHEIRTPVTLIKAPLECIISSGDGSPETKENLKVIERNSDRLLDLVNQLLDFRKIEEDQYRIHFTRTNVSKLLNELYFRFKATTEHLRLHMKLHLPPEEVYAMADPEALTKVISNLLSNALKFTKQKIEIILTSDKINGILEIRIVDDGPGIHEKYREKVFEPFYQIRNEEDWDGKGGTGIGLALTRQLVEKHDGKIFIGDCENGGCYFVIQLPQRLETALSGEMDQGPGISPKTKQPVHHTGDKMVLLIVEDNDELRTFLEKNLNQEFEILTAPNGLSALQILEEAVVDLIVSDIIMPKMDGLELSRRIKQNEQYSHIPVILLSAKTNIQSKIEGLEYGADSYIEKPFSPGYLKAQIHSLIENRVRILEKFSKSPFIPYGTIASNKRDEEFLQKLNQEIENNIQDVDYSIERMANALSMSRSNLQRKIRGISGMAPNDYIRVYRLKKAARLLVEGVYRINEICFLVGFNSGSYFSKCFQKQFGVLPKDFIRQGETE